MDDSVGDPLVLAMRDVGFPRDLPTDTGESISDRSVEIEFLVRLCWLTQSRLSNTKFGIIESRRYQGIGDTIV